MTPELLEALTRLLQYSYEDEENDWEECGKPENHIFTDIKKLSDFVSSVSEWNIEHVREP